MAETLTVGTGAEALHLKVEFLSAERGRAKYLYKVQDVDGGVLTDGSDLGGPDYGTELDALGALLSFIGAAVEAYQYGSDDLHGFTVEAVQAFDTVSDELQILELELTDDE